MAQNQTTTINVRVDETVKRNVEDLFENMGLNISTAVNMFFRQCLMEQGLPYQPKIKKQINENDGGFLLREALREAQEHAVINGMSEMTLDEINSIIAEVRRENRDYE